MPPIDFTTFVLSLSSTALVHLGVHAAPGGPSPGEPSLALARQTIELLTLVRDKTHGNLTGEEERLLDQVLHDLRLRFIQLAGPR
ncbi:MAG: DUF1844 domain-containing protein [Deltaproteobacteria bacterium]|nr:DUF1844 domain-containing protein [Deltaproteobacteria bacterium]